ncbi:TIGR00725 family protein [Legionella bozemanae]|uniref:DNA recombination-mediator protein A n=1 Tax=Legionella bozemanae TaxID=447 RepID=A0A0W0R9U3_LEGBO|nr:TIGR00725 family protein [Legionella bozemanae]KTC67824.1 DNA recombination-mediator protein A [Legionella bozemanae]STP14023.1 ABC-type spermidine/putrescine transport systems, ATPase components [Legionella bozemanae]
MFYDPKTNNFYLSSNKIFDMDTFNWVEVNELPDTLEICTYEGAVKKLQNSSNKIKQPIGVIGANMPEEDQYQKAFEIGRELSNLGLMVICGGRKGVMEAVCKGVRENNGISIGLLPEYTIESANQYVSIPLATGIGFARNALIASSSFCLIAIGGGNGTLSEVAYGLQFGKKVFSISCNLNVDELVKCNDVKTIVESICKLIFKLL